MMINTHDQLVAAGGGVALCPNHVGIRTTRIYGWHVYRVDAAGVKIVTDPKAAWYDYGRKVFYPPADLPFHERQRAALAEAQAWVKKQGWYAGEWSRNRMGDFVPADVQKRFPIQKREK